MAKTDRLWAIATYFNFAGYGTRYMNYMVFRAQLNVPLLTMELAPNGTHQLKEGDADILVKISKGDLMWQQHHLYNLAVEHLPADCEYVAFVDADVVFEEPAWPKKLATALERNALVQPFSILERLYPYRIPGVTGQMLNGPRYKPIQAIALDKSGMFGKAWGMRREIAEGGAFYGAGVVGGGDRLSIFAAMGRPDKALDNIVLSAAHESHYREWSRRYYSTIRGSIGHIPGKAYSLWHGSGTGRRYQQRHRDFQAFDFDPDLDVAMSDEGAWIWSSDKPEMHQYVCQYFDGRKEDGEYMQGNIDGQSLIALRL